MKHSGNDVYIPVMTTEYSGNDGKFWLEYDSANDNCIIIFWENKS